MGADQLDSEAASVAIPTASFVLVLKSAPPASTVHSTYHFPEAFPREPRTPQLVIAPEADVAVILSAESVTVP